MLEALPGLGGQGWGFEGQLGGADGHGWCFGSFFQEDYIPYPSIDEVGALNPLNTFW